MGNYPWNDKRRGICGICSAGCWITVTYDKKGRIDRVEPDETSPLGMICRSGEPSKEIVHSENRILQPMRRKGSKGTYEFEQISWNKAYNTLVAKLNQIKEESGPEATAFYTGSGRIHIENSRKFTKTDIGEMASEAGLDIQNWYSDPDGWFSLVEMVSTT